MSQQNRLPKAGRINREAPLNFRFNGKTYTGFEGDTLASALLANGVRHVARSFKYHRPRGIMAAGAEDPNAIVQLETGPKTQPNHKATQIELYDGLTANSVNAWPSLRYDIGAIAQLAGRFIPAAFYYKTFMWPDWHLFEPSIRKAAGLGAAPLETDPDTYDQRSVTCDILVVGGGPAALAAMRALAPSKAHIIWCDDKPTMGGSLLHRAADIDGAPSDDWIAEIEQLAADHGVRILNRTGAFGYYDHNLVGLIQDHGRAGIGAAQTLWHVRAEQVIIAAGAFERPIVFPNNDRPGIMLADSVVQYAGQYGVRCGRRAVVATNNNSAYQAALDAQAHGIDIAAIIDSRPIADGTLPNTAREHGISILTGMAPTGVRGSFGVDRVTAHQVNADGKVVDTSGVSLDADLLMVSGGWSPTVHLFSQSGGKLHFSDSKQAFIPAKAAQACQIAGAANSDFGLDAALSSGHRAALAALSALGLNTTQHVAPHAAADTDYRIAPLWRVDAALVNKAKSWVDLQNDVTVTDMGVAAAENFRAVEHLKRYTTMGMAVDQGKTSNVNAIGIMSGLTQRPVPQIGTTKFRPPFNPATIGAFAGRRIGQQLNPIRHMPTSKLAEQAGAIMEDLGGWSRPVCFPHPGESEHAAIMREARQVRETVGLFDASPLGKIQVSGPDATEFLNRIYLNRMKTLKVGRCRYGLMLKEDGIVFDDGILSRLDENLWLVGTTSGNAAPVAQLLEEWLQCEWLDLDVLVEHVTTQWSVMSVTGPRARDLLQRLDIDIDLSAESFPHMAVRTGTIAGVDCRIARVSFTGELGYEISVPWGYGKALWERLMSAGSDLGIVPFGIESLMVMRTEKGFLHIGSDTDGSTLPQDVGFGRILENKPEDFIGKRSALRADGLRDDRLNLVGLEPVDDGGLLTPGTHVIGTDAPIPSASEGFVTSSYDSPSLGHPVALGLVKNGRNRIGEIIQGFDLGRTRSVRIIQPGAYDPKGERING